MEIDRTRVPVLGRMAQDLGEHGRLRTSTAALMWAAYVGHAAASAAALAGRPSLPLPRRTAMVVGTAVGLAGAALCVAGMSRFNGPDTVAASRQQPLVTGGVYRWSRNPQYVGYVLAMGGLATARRNPAAMALTGALAGVYALWVPMEEDQLRSALGQPYVDYAARTPRWWVRPRAAARG